MPTLNFIGKDKVATYNSPFHTIEKKYNFGGETQNKIIHGDNFLALKSLLPEFKGKIKCIYIDPPYNTGNENWIYNDNVNAPQIKKWLGQVVGKEGEDLTRHEKWLCMMYPRLKLLTKKKLPVDFTRKHLSNDLLTKKFFANARFIHTSASGAMGEAGVFEVWNKNFEHYRCYWTGNFDVEKFHEAFMKDEDTPYFNEPVKNGWCFHYMGCGNNFYIKEEFNDEYLRKFDEGLKNGKNYPRDEDVFPVEQIMLEVLRNQKN